MMILLDGPETRQNRYQQKTQQRSERRPSQPCPRPDPRRVHALAIAKPFPLSAPNMENHKKRSAVRERHLLRARRSPALDSSPAAQNDSRSVAHPPLPRHDVCEPHRYVDHLGHRLAPTSGCPSAPHSPSPTLRGWPWRRRGLPQGPAWGGDVPSGHCATMFTSLPGT